MKKSKPQILHLGHGPLIAFDKFCTKRISYILVTKNRAATLNKTLKRIKNLKKNNDELIIVDGLSSDSTLKIIRKYKNVVDKYISEPDINPTHAVNKGILLASGKYIKTISDDDIYYGKAMEKAIEIMEKNNNVDVLECGGIIYFNSLKKIHIIYQKPGVNFGKNIADVFYRGSNGTGFIIRRNALAKTGIFPISIVGDLNFIINSIKNGANVKFCRIKMYKQIINKNNISLNPEVPDALYSVVKQFAPKKYFLPYACIYHMRKNPVLKILCYPLILLIDRYKRRIFTSPKSKALTKIVWDGGFS